MHTEGNLGESKKMFLGECTGTYNETGRSSRIRKEHFSLVCIPEYFETRIARRNLPELTGKAKYF